jgi:8-oxo-dGTP pyrophosphatase MutT (NUDIX family)
VYFKIYFNDKPLFLCDTVDETVGPFIHHDDTVFIDELNTHTVKAMIHEMEQEKIHAGVFYHASLDNLKKAFYKKFILVQAGGGLVENEKGEIMLIFRKGKWDLPKGKLDKGESLEECAIREVQEETGLRQVKILSPITTTYHTYHEGARFILKESYWYKMKTTGGQKLVPQTAEGIEAIRWVKPADLKKYYNECYPSVVDVLKESVSDK